MSSTSTSWTTDTNTKSGTVQIYSSNVSVLKILGSEAGDAILELFADEGDDNADKWRMWVNDADDDLHFSNYTSGAWGDLLTIQDGGYVGIGTSSPTTNLEIGGTAATGVRISSTGVGANNSYLTFATDSDGTPRYGMIGYDYSDSLIKMITGSSFDGVYSGIVVDTSGKVGIGTAKPSSLLNLSSTSSGGTSLALTMDNSTVSGSHTLGIISFQSTIDSFTTIRTGAQILAVTTETHENTGDASFGTQLVFKTATNTDPSVLTQQMTILDSGYVGIGTNTPGTLLSLDTNSGDANQSNYAIEIEADEGNASHNAVLKLGTASSDTAATQRGLIQSYIADGTTVGPLSINENGGYVGIGVTTPTALLHIDQSSTSGAVPVLKLDQADVDDSFIDFIGTTASDQTKSLSTDTTVGALTGHIKIEINGSPFWLAYYAPN